MSTQAAISIRAYEERDHAAAVHMFETGILGQISATEKPEVYKLARSWTALVGKHYSDVPGMLHAERGGRMFVAVDESDAVVGTIGISVSEDDASKQIAELVRMSVLASERRRGIGKLLLETLLKYAREELRVSAVWLDTLDINQAACALYEKHGFEKEGVRTRFGSKEEGSTDTAAVVRYRIVVQ